MDVCVPAICLDETGTSFGVKSDVSRSLQADTCEITLLMKPLSGDCASLPSAREARGQIHSAFLPFCLRCHVPPKQIQLTQKMELTFATLFRRSCRWFRNSNAIHNWRRGENHRLKDAGALTSHSLDMKSCSWSELRALLLRFLDLFIFFFQTRSEALNNRLYAIKGQWGSLSAIAARLNKNLLSVSVSKAALLQQSAAVLFSPSGIIMTLSVSAELCGEMHCHAVSDTEQDVCACLYSLPVISILAAGDKEQWHSVQAAAGFLPGHSGQEHPHQRAAPLQTLETPGLCLVLHHRHHFQHCGTFVVWDKPWETM